MNEQQGQSGRVRVYPVPDSESRNAHVPVGYEAYPTPDHLQPVGRARTQGLRGWMLVIPLLAWVACLGLAGYAVLPLIVQPEPVVRVPVTGDGLENGPEFRPQAAPTHPPIRPTEPPSATPEGAPSGMVFIHEAAAQLETCSESFRVYFVLEQMAVENPGLFENAAWRSDVKDAMVLFRDDCQSLGTLPVAPPAYAEVEHWLKKAAGEVEPATSSFTAALDREEVGQFQISIKHMLQFVDYIHNAESAIDGMLERKEI